MYLSVLLLFDIMKDQTSIIALTAPLPATPTSIQKFHVKTKGL